MSSALKILLSGMAALAAVSLSAPAAAAAAQPPAHLVIIFMENHSLSQITSDPADMPYLNSLWNSKAKRFTQYYAVTTSSFPNYAALFSGQALSASNLYPGEYKNTTVWDQLTKAGVSWAVYEESMPSVCSAKSGYNDTSAWAGFGSFNDNGQYKIGHNAVPFAGIYDTSECQNDKPLSALTGNYSNLPHVSFIAANLCNQLHGVSSTDAATYHYTGCVTGSDALEQRGDAWLKALVPNLTAISGTLVVITFDEGGHLYAVASGAGITPGTADATQYNHYSLLAYIENAYRLPLLGNAAKVTAMKLP